MSKDRLVTGSKVIILPFQEKEPDIFGVIEKADSVAVVLITSLKLTVILLSAVTSGVPVNGVTAFTMGGVVSGIVMVTDSPEDQPDLITVSATHLALARTEYIPADDQVFD